MFEKHFTAELWQYPGQAAWHFITLPIEVGEEIRLLSSGIVRRGFGSVRVTVRIGGSEWKTSIFPDKKSGSYFLPIKKQVRNSEKLVAGDNVLVQVTVDL